VTSSDKSALVVGGGIIGLASAFGLAHRGWTVTLLDPAPGKGATWAAAGMVAASAEIAPGEQVNYELQKRALPAWRELRVELREVTGTELDIHETGTLMVGWDGSDRRLVDQFAQVAAEFGVHPRAVQRTVDADMFNGLSGRINEGLFIDGDAWLDPDLAVALLIAANESLGVHVVTETVLEVSGDDESVCATTSAATYEASFGILATGAVPLPTGAAASGTNAVRPVRGMTARVLGLDRSTQPTVRAFVRGRTFYLVSRPGGYCILGATSEERSEPVVEVGEMQRLLRDALDVVPALETANLLETRMGLRPANVDFEPFFEVLAPGRWAWSSGHYRHGVTLAPLAARNAIVFGESLV
jgi:glycine oxidase